jgi:NAD(P)-dependent dehydrogenase (short-subunit alcohol dehydrogenase family)
MTGRLIDKRVAVTGAASGIGRAVAVRFAQEGARVAAIDRTPLDRRSSPDGATPIVADVTDESSMSLAFERVVAEFGGLDVLVAAAGVQLHGEDARAHELSLEAWNRTIAVNLTGAFLSCKYAIAAMIASGGGSIVIVGSPTGLRGSGRGYTAYAASKGGVHALTRVLATDYAPRGIRVNTLVPGATDTPLIEGLLADDDMRASIIEGIPLGRIARPDDYTGLAVYLASDESSYSTGALFMADGGHSIR